MKMRRDHPWENTTQPSKMMLRNFIVCFTAKIRYYMVHSTKLQNMAFHTKRKRHEKYKNTRKMNKRNSKMPEIF